MVNLIDHICSFSNMFSSYQGEVSYLFPYFLSVDSMKLIANMGLAQAGFNNKILLRHNGPLDISTPIISSLIGSYLSYLKA